MPWRRSSADLAAAVCGASMAVLSLSNAQLAYGHLPLLDGAAFAVEPGERIGLIGRNGAGKSALLKVLAGIEKLDTGLLQAQQGLATVYVPQEPVFDPAASVFEIVSAGVSEAKALRARYESHKPGDDLDALQTRIEALGGWTWEQRVATALQHLRLDGERIAGTLSGGAIKRIALAQALVAAPDVLLLDEPTNHLDLDAIAWLETLLVEWHGSLVLVTHDRAFLDAVCTRIVLLDRAALRSYPGNFAAFEVARARELESEVQAFERADKLLAQEEVWVRQGVEARRTRSAGRVARVRALREARAARRDMLGRVRLELDAGTASGKIVALLDKVSKSFGENQVVRDFSATILRGDRVGLIGPNGAGKTTLLRLILGELAPDGGTVRRGTRLTLAYFDQLRERLDPDATLAEAISPGSQWIEIGSSRKHVVSYLNDFLFDARRASTKVSSLSGGERNRLLLARLFARPANVLVLDEPTNDLDIETLELLEDLLQSYAGTLFLVSHDRRFLDNVVTSTIAFEGEGRWREYEGGVQDWLVQSQRAREASSAPQARPAAKAALPARAGSRRKLSNKEQRELAELPARVDALEAEQKALAELMASPTLYAEMPQRVDEVRSRYSAIDDELNDALERWEALGGL